MNLKVQNTQIKMYLHSLKKLKKYIYSECTERVIAKWNIGESCQKYTAFLSASCLSFEDQKVIFNCPHVADNQSTFVC